MGEVARWFKGANTPGYAPSDPVFLPEASSFIVPEWIPSPDCKKRAVFTTAFHQGTKYRDFVRGVIPDLREGESGFTVTSGVLFEAARFASEPGAAALVVIDEINRGPAVQAFGDALVALETDKRLGKDGQRTDMTQSFRILADDGGYEEFSLPYDLYLLAAMNQADTSVEPMDVAFLRRWEPYRIEPDVQVLKSYFRLNSASATSSPSPSAAYALLIQAWQAVNRRLRLGRGPEFMVGHGVLMSADAPPATYSEALNYCASGWGRIFAHIEEVFFGDLRGAAAALAVGASASHPLQLHEAYFGEMPVLELIGDARPTGAALITLLEAVISGDQ